MLARAFATGVKAAWVVGDTVYGYEELRSWLVAALLPKDAWVPLSAGEGSQGPRLYEWAWLEGEAEPRARHGGGSWLLIRRSLTQPNKRAYYRAWGPKDTRLAELVQVAGRRWTIEAGLEEAKGEVGLDHYEVRTWTAWYRHITLALLAHALLVVLRSQAEEDAQKGGQSSTRSD
jgi:SRSO17 transposase